MTAKEKAQDIFDKMHKTIGVMCNYPSSRSTAKDCALIAIEQMIIEVPDEILDTYKGETAFIINDRHDYLLNVKKEIKKIKL